MAGGCHANLRYSPGRRPQGHVPFADAFGTTLNPLRWANSTPKRVQQVFVFHLSSICGRDVIKSSNFGWVVLHLDRFLMATSTLAKLKSITLRRLFFWKLTTFNSAEPRGGMTIASTDAVIGRACSSPACVAHHSLGDSRDFVKGGLGTARHQ